MIDFTDFASSKSKNFVGRSDVLTEITSNIANHGGHYIFLKALAGMGKSAIMAHLYQQFSTSKQTSSKEEQTPQDAIWLFHFCMHTNGRDNAVTAYRSLLTQLQQALGFQKVFKNMLSFCAPIELETTLKIKECTVDYRDYHQKSASL